MDFFLVIITLNWSDVQSQRAITDLDCSDWAYSLVMAKGTGYTDQTYFSGMKFPLKEIEHFWNLGMDVTELTTCLDLWLVVMSEETEYTNQTVKTSSDFPKEWVQQKWKDNYRITHLCYNNVWAVVMSKGTGYTMQSYTWNSSFPKEWVQKKWKESYQITHIGNGGGVWPVVMSKGSSITTQTWRTDSKVPKDWMSDKMKDGYHITDVANKRGTWVVVMSKGCKLWGESWWSRRDFPVDIIQSELESGREISKNIETPPTKSSYSPIEGNVIQMTKEHGGTFTIPCKINGIAMKLIFDTGASAVSLSLVEALFMVRNGYMDENDFIGTEYYQIANGEIEEGTVVNIDKIEFGGVELTNIKASISHNIEAPLLLGQSALNKLGKIMIDYEKSNINNSGIT